VHGGLQQVSFESNKHKLLKKFLISIKETELLIMWLRVRFLSFLGTDLHMALLENTIGSPYSKWTIFFIRNTFLLPKKKTNL